MTAITSSPESKISADLTNLAQPNGSVTRANLRPPRDAGYKVPILLNEKIVTPDITLVLGHYNTRRLDGFQGVSAVAELEPSLIVGSVKAGLWNAVLTNPVPV